MHIRVGMASRNNNSRSPYFSIFCDQPLFVGLQDSVLLAGRFCAFSLLQGAQTILHKPSLHSACKHSSTHETTLKGHKCTHAENEIQADDNDAADDDDDDDDDDGDDDDDDDDGDVEDG